MMQSRTSQRRRVLKTGSIALYDGAIFSCTVRNLSETGACLEFGTPLVIPERVILSIPSDHIKRQCSIKWRTGTRAGVEFN
jgi:PilZ domain